MELTRSKKIPIINTTPKTFSNINLRGEQLTWIKPFLELEPEYNSISFYYANEDESVWGINAKVVNFNKRDKEGRFLSSKTVSYIHKNGTLTPTSKCYIDNLPSITGDTFNIVQEAFTDLRNNEDTSINN